MSTERKKVLEMLVAGKISAEEAEKLLDKLSASGAGRSASEEKAADESSTRPQKQRYLRILVDRPDRNEVNIRVPLAFIRGGMALVGVLPARVTSELAEKGIDLSSLLAGLKGQELNDALQELNVHVDRADGKKVQIFCE